MLEAKAVPHPTDAPPRPPPAVSVEGVSKTYRIPRGGPTSVTERLAERLRPVQYDEFTALEDVSFQVARGEFMGIVGRNGSGKSTLLKIVAGIYDASEGRVRVTGRLSPFIEMGVGFKPDLTGRENIMLNGAMLGVSRRKLRRRLPEILAFAELEEFADLKLKNYSSGMSVRLSFSTAIHADADVLLVDEVLAVGDAAFQEKCYEQFERLKQEGRTVLFVTHSMDAIERFCDRALLLDRHRVAAIGEPAEIARRYGEVNRRHVEERARESPDAARGPVRRPPAFRDAPKPATYRPSALGEGLKRFAQLTLVLSRSEVRLHYQGSVLGFLWSILRPLALFAVLYTVLSRAAGFGRGVEDYGVYLLAGIVLWTFFAETTGGGVASLVKNSSLLRKLRFPRLAIPLSIAGKATFNLGMNALALVVFIVIADVEPRLSWLELPLLVAILGTFATGIAMALSALYVRYRDTQQAWQVALQLLFYSSPILYVAAFYPGGVKQVLALSPLSAIFTEMRHALLDPTAPTAAAAAGGAEMLLVPAAIVVVSFAGGLWLFLREAPLVAERL